MSLSHALARAFRALQIARAEVGLRRRRWIEAVGLVPRAELDALTARLERTGGAVARLREDR